MEFTVRYPEHRQSRMSDEPQVSRICGGILLICITSGRPETLVHTLSTFLHRVEDTILGPLHIASELAHMFFVVFLVMFYIRIAGEFIVYVGPPSMRYEHTHSHIT